MAAFLGADDFGIYIHVPYCRERCLYCDFALTPVDRAPSAAFSAAAVAEIAAFGERPVAPGLDLAANFHGRKAVSVYFGGGTPSMLEARDIARILESVEKRFGIAAGAEITLEANPEDASFETISGFKSAGVNRLSLGVQALDDRFLRALGRAHDAKAAAASVGTARAAGIENVSIDLIFGVMGMTPADWEQEVDAAIALHPSHLSCYGLTVERGTKLARLVDGGSAQLPIEDDQATMYEETVARLAAGGLPRYEISNFARAANQAVHNNLYWRYQEWVGIGPSSHSFARVPDGGVRWWNGKNPFRYLESAPPGPGAEPRPARSARSISGHEVITGRAAMGEMAFTAMRLAEGLSETRFEQVFGVTVESIYGATFRRLGALGLAVRENGRVRLTDRGFLISDSVFSDLVGEDESPKGAKNGGTPPPSPTGKPFAA